MAKQLLCAAVLLDSRWADSQSKDSIVRTLRAWCGNKKLLCTFVFVDATDEIVRPLIDANTSVLNVEVVVCTKPKPVETIEIIDVVDAVSKSIDDATNVIIAHASVRPFDDFSLQNAIVPGPDHSKETISCITPWFVDADLGRDPVLCDASEYSRPHVLVLPVPGCSELRAALVESRGSFVRETAQRLVTSAYEAGWAIFNPSLDVRFVMVGTAKRARDAVDADTKPSRRVCLCTEPHELATPLHKVSRYLSPV
jgi:hypothetical protein